MGKPTWRQVINNYDLLYTSVVANSKAYYRCTMASYYGCKRQGGAGGTIINPIMSARLRTADSFTFMYGKVEVKAKVIENLK